MMKDNITLRELNIRIISRFDIIGGNEFKEEGGIFIATGITSNRALTLLDVGWNDLGPECTRVMAESLKENNTLMAFITRT